MIEVTIDMVPGGNSKLRRNIGKLTIANQSGLADVSNYSFRVFDQDGELTTSGCVSGHKRAQGIWPLLRHIFQQL